MWEIQKKISKGDYLYALVPEHPKATKNGYVLYHRIIMENHLGRLLSSEEVVHHRDNNKHNNNIDNLEVLTKVEHNKLHGALIKQNVELICTNCGKVFQRSKRNSPKAKNTKNSFCSRSCNGKYNGYKPL